MRSFTKKMMVLGISITTLALSCKKDIGSKEIVQKVEETKSQKLERMKEFSKLLGAVLLDENNRAYIANVIHASGENSECVSFNSILRKNAPISESMAIVESGQLNTIDAQATLFKSALVQQAKENLDMYPRLSSGIQHISANNVSSVRKASDGHLTVVNEHQFMDELLDYYSSLGFDIYVPYESDFNLKNAREIILTWDPLVEQDWTSGYVISTNKNVATTSTTARSASMVSMMQTMERITEEDAMRVPTFVIRPTEIDPVYPEHYPVPMIGIPLLPNKSGASTNNPNPSSLAFKGWQGFLTENVDHRKIMEDDILKVSIPRIRLMEHLGTWFTPTHITLYKSSKSNFKTDAYNNLVFPLSPADNVLLCSRFKITRKDAKKHNWVDFNQTWDENWKMSEHNESLVWASHHTFSGTLNVKGKVKLGYDVVAKKVSADANVDVAFSFKVGGNCRLEYNNTISRQSVLSQNIGDTGAGTYNDNGTHYTIRTAGKMQYYFKPYLTKIVE